METVAIWGGEVYVEVYWGHIGLTVGFRDSGLVLCV